MISLNNLEPHSSPSYWWLHPHRFVTNSNDSFINHLAIFNVGFGCDYESLKRWGPRSAFGFSQQGFGERTLARAIVHVTNRKISMNSENCEAQQLVRSCWKVDNSYIFFGTQDKFILFEAFHCHFLNLGQDSGVKDKIMYPNWTF